jgi:exonuclease SbcC
VSVADLRTITISDFRSIRGKVAIALNAPVVLLHGTNGAGKSTVMSALELALTGRVSGVDPPDAEHLVHRGARKTVIELVSSEDSVYVTIEDSRIEGAPLLEPDDRRFFGERCYLQQRTLGRLLELYEKPIADGDSPLTLFIKDLLGLGELDALIDGLYPVTDKRRVKRLVGDYSTLDRELDQRREEIQSLEADMKKAAADVADARDRLREILTALEAPSPLEDNAEGAASWLEQRTRAEERALIELVRARRELAALTTRAQELAKQASVEEVTELETAAAATRAAVEEWRMSHGAALEALLNEIRAVLPGVPAAAGAADPASVRATALEQVKLELDRLTHAIAADESARHETERLDRAVEAGQRRITGIDEQLAALGTATEAEELGKALGALIPHVHTEHCPVCGRDYAEVSHEPLSAQLASRVSELGAQAERLRELAKARLEALSDLRRAEDERGAVSQRRMEPDAKIEAQAIVGRLQDAQRRLIALAAGLAEGATIIRDATERERDLTVARNQDRASLELRAALESVAAALGQPTALPATPLEKAIATLSDYVTAQIDSLETRSERRTAAGAALGLLVHTRELPVRLEREIAHKQAAFKRGEAAVAELERRRSAMRMVRDEAQAARLRLVRRVFTESLNRVWRDLFVRLAPEEPFVPAFRVPDANEGVVAILETVHRDGKPGGPPEAMLSAGNLNTAALTLFLALNLSVPQRLPWILLDDPVQSMDEVHVAQFAALLRTLARDHGRAVIIAVHERALFDYLALELSPASRHDGLVTVELSRAPDGTTSAEPDFESYVEDRAFETA